MNDDDLDPLIDRADLDGLVRLIDARCETRDWEGLFRLRSRVRLATQTGRQIWPAATLADYRLALHAPPEWAAQVLSEDSGRFSIGPLTEVIAQKHSWSDLAAFLPDGPRRAFIAHERVMRGEIIDDLSVANILDVLDIPVNIQPWEPQYPVATYSDTGIEAHSPSDNWQHQWNNVDSSKAQPPSVIDDPYTNDAWRTLVEPWTSSSQGHAESVVVDGDALDALAALGLRHCRLSDITTHQALAWLVWCGSSGGAHGRRRGAALGRFGAWWLIAAIGGFTEEWDALGNSSQLSDEVADTAAAMHWMRFDDGSHSPFEMSLIAQDPDNNIAVALVARDAPA